MSPYLDMNFKVLVRKKIVLVGDGGCGKTCLLNVYTRGYFPLVYEPTVYENYVQDVIINDRLRVELTLWDTAGQEEFNRLRALSYNDAHVVMVCYSIDNKDSLDNISYRWVDELREQCPRANIVLVALKCDLRNTESHQKVVLYEEGLAVARKMNAVGYFECSAKHNRGVQECFHQAAKIALKVNLPSDYILKKEKKCVIL